MEGDEQQQATSVENNVSGMRPLVALYARCIVVRMSRARWFKFLRRVYRYQNGSRSADSNNSNPFDSGLWLSLECSNLVVQIVVVTITIGLSRNERPVWPLRSWLALYNLANLISLLLLYYRYRHSLLVDADIEQQNIRNDGQESRSSRSYCRLMNKSRTCLELFYGLWFVMGNVWMFDTRYGLLSRAPKLNGLCITLLAWNALLYSFPLLLFLLLCCFVPLVSSMLGYNMNLASSQRGASDDQISQLPHWQWHHKDMQCTHIYTTKNTIQECCICLAKYRDKEEVRQLPCMHVFHMRCVDHWLRIMSSCPLCKQQLDK